MLLYSDKKPLVSIGMPTYNGERFIRKAIDSLLVQDYKDFELIISDNASTDKTQQILYEYAAVDKRVRIIAQYYNIGILPNFKTVLSPVSGKYFMWAADDDYWYPEFISTLVEELEKHQEAGVAMCAVNRVYQDNTLMDTIQFKGKDNPNYRTFYQMMKSLTSSKKYNLYIYGLFRTKILKKIIFLFPDTPLLDRLFICQIAMATKFRYVDKILHTRLIHDMPSTIRLPEEKFNKMQRNKFYYFKISSTLGKTILKSPIIPWYRKLYTPIAMIRIVWFSVLPMIYSVVKKIIPAGLYNRLKLIKKDLLDRIN